MLTVCRAIRKKTYVEFFFFNETKAKALLKLLHAKCQCSAVVSFNSTTQCVKWTTCMESALSFPTF